MQHIVFMVISLLNAWLLMQVVHECGHVLAAFASGGEVKQVVLHPLVISRTDIIVNPHPLFVSRSGAIFGALFPVLVAFLARKTSMAYLLWGFAGFCLIANGVYMGSGLITPDGDTWDIIFFGGQPWTLGLFALCTIPTGLYAWHRVSADFGFSGGNGVYNRKHAVVSIVLFIFIVTAEIIWSQ
jgi:hypothetical protein